MKSAVLRFEDKPEELVLIELQSTAYMEDGSKVTGQELGTLQLKGGTVVLTNGPRSLYGSLQELKSPLVLLERTGQEEQLVGDARAALLRARGVIRRKVVFNQRPQLSV
ncbi:unnamed protein product [Symbiodinium microadriaticum]|nr:unnamed protein product [Symbiodinium microadriaticum]